jgi:hypothetical protein
MASSGPGVPPISALTPSSRALGFTALGCERADVAGMTNSATATTRVRSIVVLRVGGTAQHDARTLRAATTVAVETFMRRTIAVIALLATVACSRRDMPARDSARQTRGADSGAVRGAAATTVRPDTVVRVTTMFTLTSPAFQGGDSIPRQFTCDGADVSPPLGWLAPPSGTASFALIVEDPDAPGGTYIHWVLYDLPGAMASLPEAVPKGAELS